MSGKQQGEIRDRRSREGLLGYARFPSVKPPVFTYFLSDPYKCHGNQAFSLIRITKDPHASANLDETRYIPFTAVC